MRTFTSRYKLLIACFIMLLTTLGIRAQEVTVNVSANYPILPPQVLNYVNNPSDYFTVTIVNNTDEDQMIYLGLELTETGGAGLTVSTPPNYPPKTPFIIPGSGTKQYTLTKYDMKHLFDDIPSTAMQVPNGLIDGYNNGSFGLLPEDVYEVHFVAYRWQERVVSPQAVSNPMGGKAIFRVCYNASAPVINYPVIGVGDGDFDVAKLSVKNPIIQWQPAVQGCNGAQQFDYTLKIVEVSNLQTPDVAMEQSINVPLQKSGLRNTAFIIPPTDINGTKFKVGQLYAAQVTATASDASAINYVKVVNDGKSNLRVFRFVEEEIELPHTEEKEEEKEKNKYEDFDWEAILGDCTMADSLFGDSLYNFRHPEILKPSFGERTVRKVYINNPIKVEWRAPWYLQGEGENPSRLEFEYDVELYNGKENTDWEEVLATTPIYKIATTELTDSIPWDDIAEKVNVGDFMLLRINPRCTNETSVGYVNDSLRCLDFVMTKHLSKEYFECSNTVTIDNTTPTTKSKDDFIGKEVGIGEYELTIDEITGGDAENGFVGKGRVKWEIGIGTAMVCVQFDALKINTDDIVYEGNCTTYAGPEMTDYDAVTNIFSDLGIEDLIAKTGVPYADKVTEKAKTTAAEAAKGTGIGNYYSLVQQASSIVDLLSGKPVDVHMPLCIPKAAKGAISALNSSPVDIQVTTMTFAPTWATMDLLGEFQMPNSDYLGTDILLFGAPRLCISPNHLIPESGQLALLGNFTVKDPSTGFDCTFKAPTDVLKPTNGCYISWKDYKFEVLGVDADMTIPKLKKYDDKAKKVTEEHPILNLRGTIAAWDDFTIDNISMDPFEVDGLPDFTFYCQNISIDHSVWRNVDNMATYKWPASFDKVEAVGDDIYREHGIEGWQGLYIGKIGVLLPSGIISGTDRIEISGQHMLFDQSGATLDVGFFAGDDGLMGSIGGFELALKEVALSFVQSNFNNCHMDGSLAVPFVKNDDGDKAKIGFTCQIRKQLADDGKEKDALAYIFSTQSLNGDFNLDMFVAKMKLEKELTYFLLEAEKDSLGEMQTKCELLLGGRIEIGGKGKFEDWIEDKLGFKISVPDIHFVGMRIANCEEWKSKYVELQADLEAKRADQKKNALAGLYADGKGWNNDAKTFYFHTGSWSLASMSKKLGPFEFSIGDFNLVTDTDEEDASAMIVGLQVTGKVALVKGIDLSASTTLTIQGKVKNITDFSNIEASYKNILLNKIEVNTSFCGMAIEGSVEFDHTGAKDKAVGKGFCAHLKIALPGDLFAVEGDGGYFPCEATDDEEAYSWGWVHVALSGHVELGPCQITKLGGGFYMNCSRNKNGDKEKPNNVAGLVGIYLELGMATPDGATMSGDLTLNVVYNRKRKCLSNFIMTGNVKAAGGLIDSKMTLVYENSPSDRYLQLNITVDASISAESVAGAVGEFGGQLGTIKQQLDKLAGKAFDVLGDVQAGLGDKIGEKDKDGNPKGGDPAAAAKGNDQKTTAGMAKATISLDVKVTWRTGGKNLDKPLWHVYLGEPDESKRCSFVLIDVDTKIVKVKIGANGYVCVGNELPNNGQLPPIPAKIAKFLDGSTKGDGLASDNISTANASREAAMNSFKNDGGVMLGAQVYGGIGIDLGIIYGSLDALAGFDISLVHYTNAYCVNLKKKPGFEGWYGQGQLYAYLAMELGVRFNLGFVHWDIPLASAGIGGVLKLGGPNPTYFTGKVRAKISLLGGLFKLNKKYEFDCGQTCQLFQGNALDNFKLFGNCTLGDTIQSKGWNTDADTASVTADYKGAISSNIYTPQYVDTEAPLEEHFRILDKNELETILKNLGDGADSLAARAEMQACRTFIFRGNPHTARLYTYNKPRDYTGTTTIKFTSKAGSYLAGKTVTVLLKSTYYPYYTNQQLLDLGLAVLTTGESRVDDIPFTQTGSNSRHYLDLATLRKVLKPGKYYRLEVYGRAFEILEGIEKDPWTVDTITGKADYKYWAQTTSYYFRTRPVDTVSDKAPLQEYVALAYPSNFNQLKSTMSDVDEVTQLVKPVEAYLNDVQRPTIALTEDLSTKAFKKGKLYWRLLNTMGKQIDIVENAWVKTKDANGKVIGLNMEPKKALNAQAGGHYILTLDYFTNEQVRDADTGKTSTETLDTTLVYLYVHAQEKERDWRTGLASGKSADYEQPFVAQQLINATFTNEPYKQAPTDVQVLDNSNYNYDPFWYAAWQSNFGFPAGWHITEKNWFHILVTTSESVIFQDPAHGGKYEGVYLDKKNSQYAYNAYNDVKSKTIYTYEMHKDVPYPLSGYWQDKGHNKWDYVFGSDPRIQPYAVKGSASTYKACVDPLFQKIDQVYDATQRISEKINKTAAEASNLTDSVSDKKYALRNWYHLHFGQYLSEDGFVANTDDSLIYFVPAYQFPPMWSMWNLEKASGAYESMDNNSDRAKRAKDVWQRMTYWNSSDKKWKAAAGFSAATARKRFTAADVEAYRVNTYDFQNARYDCSESLMNGPATITLTVTNPLLGSRSVSIQNNGRYNSGTYSSGEGSGTDVTGISDKKDDDDNNVGDYAALEEATKTILQLHDSIEFHFKGAETAFKSYPNAYSTLKKHADQAKSYAEYAVESASKHPGDESYTDIWYKDEVTYYDKAVEVWNDILKYVKDTNPDEDYHHYKSSTRKEGGHYITTYTPSVMDAAGKNLVLVNAAYEVIRKMSDTSSKKFKEYESLVFESRDWVEKMKQFHEALSSYTNTSQPYGEATEFYMQACWANNYVEHRLEKWQKQARSLCDQVYSLEQDTYNLFELSKTALQTVTTTESNSSTAFNKLPLKSGTKVATAGILAMADQAGLSQQNYTENVMATASLSYTKAVIANATTVIAAASTTDSLATVMAGYKETGDRKMVTIEGEDGNGGLLAQILTIVHAKCKQYKDAKDYRDLASKNVKSIGTNATTAETLAEKCAERVNSAIEVRRIAQRRLDKLEGRDPDVADRADSLIEEAIKKVESFTALYVSQSELGKGYRELKDIYEEINRLRDAYWKGNLLEMQPCLDKCNEFIKKYEENETYTFARFCEGYDNMTHAVDTAWTVFAQGGYTDKDVRMKDAKAHWQNDSGIQKLGTWLKQVDVWRKELDKILNGTEDGEIQTVEAAAPQISTLKGVLNFSGTKVSTTSTSSATPTLASAAVQRQTSTSSTATSTTSSSTATSTTLGQRTLATSTVGLKAISASTVASGVRLSGAAKQDAILQGATATSQLTAVQVSSSSNGTSNATILSEAKAPSASNAGTRVVAGSTATTSTPEMALAQPDAVTTLREAAVCVMAIKAEVEEFLGEDPEKLYIMFYYNDIIEDRNVVVEEHATAKRAKNIYDSYNKLFTTTASKFESNAANVKALGIDTYKKNVDALGGLLMDLMNYYQPMSSNYQLVDSTYEAMLIYLEDANVAYDYIKQHCAPSSTEYVNGGKLLNEIQTDITELAAALPSMRTGLEEAQSKLNSYRIMYEQIQRDYMQAQVEQAFQEQHAEDLIKGKTEQLEDKIKHEMGVQEAIESAVRVPGGGTLPGTKLGDGKGGITLPNSGGVTLPNGGGITLPSGAGVTLPSGTNITKPNGTTVILTGAGSKDPTTTQPTLAQPTTGTATLPGTGLSGSKVVIPSNTRVSSTIGTFQTKAETSTVSTATTPTKVATTTTPTVSTVATPTVTTPTVSSSAARQTTSVAGKTTVISSKTASTMQRTTSTLKR